MTVTALGSPVTAEAFVIASEPAPDQPRGAARLCAAVLRTAPNRLICTRCDDGARPRRDANFGDLFRSRIQTITMLLTLRST
jgi:hypothetical protein